MGDLKKLTPEELLEAFRASAFGINEWAEIRRRLERLERLEGDANFVSNEITQEYRKLEKRLEKCETALRDIKAVDPDNYTSGYVRPNWESAKLIWQGKHQIALKVIQDAARSALEGE